MKGDKNSQLQVIISFCLSWTTYRIACNAVDGRERRRVNERERGGERKSRESKMFNLTSRTKQLAHLGRVAICAGLHTSHKSCEAISAPVYMDSVARGKKFIFVLITLGMMHKLHLKFDTAKHQEIST